MDDKQFAEFLYDWSATLIANRDAVYKNVERDVAKIERIKKLTESLDEARMILNNEISSIQSTLKEDIDTLVTIAIGIVYEDRDIQFAFMFEKKPSGESAYKPVLIERGEEFDPKDEQCGGVLDVISYALRPILHGFEKTNPRLFLWSDEPFKFLGGGIYGARAAEMRKSINEKLGMQEVVIAHDEETIMTADYIYKVTFDGKKSTVKRTFPVEIPKTIKRIRSS